MNGKRFQSPRQELKASKEEAMTLERKMKRTRGWKLVHVFYHKPKRYSGMEADTNKPRMKPQFF